MEAEVPFTPFSAISGDSPRLAVGAQLEAEDLRTAARPSQLDADGADLPTRSIRAAAALGVLIAAAFLALAAGLGLLISSVVYGYGGLG